MISDYRQGMQAWIWWAVAATGLAALELLTLDLTLLMLAGAAAIGASIAWVGGPAWLQFVGAALAAVGLLGLVRPVALRHRKQAPEIRTGTAALVGSTALTLEPVDSTRGLVKLNGETWSARSYDNSVIAENQSVQVIEIDGATAKVLPL